MMKLKSIGGRVLPMTPPITAPSPASHQHGRHGTTVRTRLAATSLMLVESFACLVLVAASAAGVTEERTVSGVRISLGDEGRRWTLVPTLLGGKVESFLALREEIPFGENLTAVWYRKRTSADGAESWEPMAFAEQDQSKAIRAVKDALSLSDATDGSWPVAVAPVAAPQPEAMVKGVLETDALAPMVAALENPQPFVEMLEGAGWAAAAIDASLEVTECQDVHLFADVVARAEAEHIRLQQGSSDGSFFPQELPCGRSRTIAARLKADGTWIIPELSALLPQFEPHELIQVPSAGTIVRGASSVLVEFRSSNAGDLGDVMGQVVVHLYDSTPPELSVEVSSSATIHQPRGRLPYIVAPATYTLRAAAVDRGEPIAVTSPAGGAEVQVSGAGFHIVKFGATDSAGLSVERTELLEIRDRPLLDAEIVVEALAVESNGEAGSLLTTTLLLGARDFDMRQIHLGTTQLRVLGETGELLAPPASVIGISLCDASCLGTGGAPGSVGFMFDRGRGGAEFELGYWRLRYEVVLAADSPPPAILELAGASKDSLSPSFDFVATTGARESEVAVAELAVLGAIHPDVFSGEPDPTTGDPSDVTPPVECRWVDSFTPLSGDPIARCLNEDECGFTYTWTEIASVRIINPVGRPRGSGSAYAEDCLGDISCSASSGVGGLFKMWLVPTPPCSACLITTTAFPIFTVAAGVDAPALAVAGAQIEVRGGGVDAVAVGAVGAGSNPPATIEVGSDPEVTVTIGQGEMFSRTFSSGAPAVGFVSACSVTVSIGSAAPIDVWADNWPFFNYGSSWANIGNPSPNLHIHGEVIDGPCAGLSNDVFYR